MRTLCIKQCGIESYKIISKSFSGSGSNYTLTIYIPITMLNTRESDFRLHCTLFESVEIVLTLQKMEDLTCDLSKLLNNLCMLPGHKIKFSEIAKIFNIS